MWIADNEKYALIALDVKTKGDAVFGQMAPDLWVIPNRAFDIPDHWKEWLGSIRIKELEGCNLFLLSKLPSKTPGVLDAENQTLRKRVWHFYVGLVLSSPFSPAHTPMMLTGTRENGETDIRQQEVFDSPIKSSVHHYPAITPSEMQSAANIGKQLQLLAGYQGSRWRLYRTFSVYMEARTTRDTLDRLHQYCRCVEGLILPKAGNTKKQFKSRTVLFIGPGHHDLMGDTYDIRSGVEHLHENKYLDPFNREKRLDILRKEAVIEHIARTCLARIIAKPSLWDHFGNTSALSAFWSLAADEQQKVWGAPIDALAPLADFKPEHISNSELGAAD